MTRTVPGKINHIIIVYWFRVAKHNESFRNILCDKKTMFLLLRVFIDKKVKYLSRYVGSLQKICLCFGIHSSVLNDQFVLVFNLNRLKDF